MARYRSIPLILGTLLLTTGCVDERMEGDTAVFTFAPWAVWSVVLASLVAPVAGWFLRKHANRIAWVMMILGPISLVFIAPSMFSDRATVNPQRFTLRTGAWFAPTVHEVRFDDLSQIDLISEVSSGRRRSKSYYLLCHRKAGAEEKVPIGDLMKNGAVERILETAHGRGIPIQNLTGE